MTRTPRVVPVLAPLDAIDALAGLARVERVETDWFPRSPLPALD